MEEQLELEAQIQREMSASNDFVEGAMAFAQKRETRFSGTLDAKWQTSSSPYRRSLNRIRAAVGHLLPSTFAFFTPESGGSPNANEIVSLYKITLVIAVIIFVRGRGRADLRPDQVPLEEGQLSPHRSAGTPAWRPAGRCGGADPRRARGRHVHEARSDPEPAELERVGCNLTSLDGPIYASASAEAAARTAKL